MLKSIRLLPARPGLTFNNFLLTSLLSLLGIAIAFGSAAAATIVVRKDGSGNYTTIQAAVNAMAARDVCLVGPGVYSERITFPTGKSGNASGYTTVKAETKGTVDMWGFDTRNCNYLRLEGFNITVPTNLSGAGIVARSSNLLIVSNFIHDVLAEGVNGSGGTYNNIQVIGNRIYHIGRGLFVTGTNWLVEANEIERLVYYAPLSDADYVIFFGVNHILRNNYFHGTIDTEIGPAHVDGFQSWDDNHEFIQHVRIEGNRLQDFYHQGVIMQALYYSNSFDIVICNNQFFDARAWGVLAQKIRDVKINNNLFKDINSNGVGINKSATGEARNNIFYNVCCWDVDTSPTNGSKNIWYRPGFTVSGRFNGDLLNANPKFVNVTNGDYHLQASSPAVNAGAVATNVLVDAEGVARPQGSGWDIGPFEYRITIPQLSGAVRQGGNLLFTLVGEPGRVYQIQSSTNLIAWASIGFVTLSNATALVSQPIVGFRQCFRALLVP